ncbi:MAG: hypothetical protein DA408_02980 [Bacteroidetes bacterium]|nr:MAG: hypothetical protein C7N36_06670 [Bacteroidota bacterium]PTM14563.1 MAG: hypothetical protein DA408_02980 [Bacteroidota bacterium]
MKYKKLAAAKQNYLLAMGLAQQLKSASALAHVEGCLGKLALLEGNYKLALAYWEIALENVKQTQNKRQIAICLHEIVVLAMLNEALILPKHEEYVKESSRLATEIGTFDLQADAALLLGQIAVAKGDLKAAYFYHEQYRQFAAALIKQNKDQAITAIQENFTAKNLAQEHLVAAHQDGEELNRANTQLWNALLLCITAFLGILLLTYHQSYRQQAKLARKLEHNNKELAAKNIDLEKFANITSHDLKEPLRNIGAFADLLNRRYHEKLDQDGKDYLGFILSSARHMNQLLNDLLAYTKLANPPLIKPSPIQLKPLINEVVQQFELTLASRKINLEVDTHLPQVMGYPHLLRELFRQLLDNAIKFSRPTAATISIGYRVTTSTHLFWIEDNGIGMQPVYQTQIFDIFQRLDKQNYQGTGVGLAMCKKIVEYHGGKIWVKSAEDNGSQFFFTLPHSSKGPGK